MFKNVVVGVDQQQNWRDAVALATELTDDDGRFTLAHVFRGGRLHGHGQASRNETYGKQRSIELLEAACIETGVQARLRVHDADSDGAGLQRIVDQVGADLLVVGSSRRALLGRVLIGDDMQSALNGLPCALAIAPARYGWFDPGAIGNIGVGYDGSPESEAALGLARALAIGCDAQLSACQVVSASAELLVGTVTMSQALDQARQHLSALGGVNPHAAYGQPAEQLAVFGDNLDLLVVGSRGHGPVSRLVHGSTSLKLATMAHCPLLVLPRSADRAEARTETPDGRFARSPAAAR
jgi:nucleotide-binding universal stress UspA family protein